MMGFGYGSNVFPAYGMLAMGGMGLFWLLVLGAIIWAVVHFSQRSAPSNDGRRSMDILRERYARGEIDEEEFDRRMDRLK